MSKTIQIQSAAQFSELLTKSRIVVADFYADWCGPCKQIAPIYEQLSQSLSRPRIATFVKINTEGAGTQAIAKTYGVTALPTFIIFRNGKVTEKIKGANPRALQAAVEKLVSDIATAGEDGGADGEGGPTWLGADLPRGYSDISDIIDVRGLELLNADTNFSVRTLFKNSKPASLDKTDSDEKDWVESDTDEQLLLYMPFNSSVKLHTLQITSVPPKAGDDEDESEIPGRPKNIKLYTNRPHNLGFDEADDIQATQEIEIEESMWNANGSASIPLRFVRFQNITSLVMFVVDADGRSEKVRLDRIRLVGESGEKREMGKLEKIGDHPGE